MTPRSLFATIMEWPWNRKDPELKAAPEQKSAMADIVDHLVAALPDPILILDSEGIVIKANANAEEMLEMKPAGLHLSQAIRAPAVLEAVARSISQGGNAVVDYEVRGPLARNFEVYVSPIMSAESERDRKSTRLN